MTSKLPFKLALVFSLAVLLGLGAGYFYLASRVTTFVDGNIEAGLKRELVLGRELLEARMDPARGMADAGMLAAQIAKDLNVRATIIAFDGTVVADSGVDAKALKDLESHLDRVEVRQAIATGFGTSKRYSRTLNKEMLYSAVAFDNGRSSGVFRLAIPLSNIYVVEQEARRVLLVSLGLVFILSLLLMLFLSYLVSSPLLKMAVIARAMAKGDFSVKPSLVSGDEIGELAGALAHLSDEIQEKIETIKEEAAKLDAVLCSMSEGVMVSDEKGEVLLMNPSFRKTFLIEGEPRGRKVWEVVSHRALLEMSEGLISGTATSAGRDVEINVPDERVLKVNAAAVLKDGKFSGAVMVFHDITELKRLEHVRQDFVANVSHELRTPVANIKGYAETLLEGALDDKDSARQFVGIIAENGRRLEDLINDLLDLSKIESGKLPLLFSSLNVAQLIRKAAAILEKNIRDKHLSLEIRIPEDLPRISADEARLMQVFINLIDNAIKYTLAGGSLLIVAEDNERQVRIDVIDTGVGIPERDLPRIFERFYRVEKARSREQGGTGLGLSIVKHIVQAHGGQVWASSAPGQGTTFSFTIPKASVQ